MLSSSQSVFSYSRIISNSHFTASQDNGLNIVISCASQIWFELDVVPVLTVHVLVSPVVVVHVLAETAHVVVIDQSISRSQTDNINVFSVLLLSEENNFTCSMSPELTIQFVDVRLPELIL